MHISRKIIENGKARICSGDFRNKVSKKPRESFPSKQDEGDPFIKQLITLIQEFDPDLIAKLENLRNSLKNGSTNLLDEMIDTSLTDLTDEDINALFRFAPYPEKKPEKKHCFCPIKGQK